MDFSWLSSLGTNVGNGIGTPPSNSGIQGAENFRFGDTPQTGSVVRPAMAIASPTNTALGPDAAAGTLGGAGMAAPAGSSAVPHQNTMSGQSGVGAGLADSFKAIGDMIYNMDTASAYGQQIVASQAPQTMFRPALATFSIPTMSRT